MLKHDRAYSACEFRKSMRVIMKFNAVLPGWHIDSILRKICDSTILRTTTCSENTRAQRICFEI